MATYDELLGTSPVERALTRLRGALPLQAMRDGCDDGAKELHVARPFAHRAHRKHTHALSRTHTHADDAGRSNRGTSNCARHVIEAGSAVAKE